MDEKFKFIFSNLFDIQRYLNPLPILSFSVFLYYFTIYPLLPKADSEIIKNLMLISLIMIPVWFVIFANLRELYFKILNYFLLKCKEKKIITDYREIFLIWSIPGIILCIVAIYLFYIFNYYIKFDEKMMDPTIDSVKSAVVVHSNIFLITVIISIILIILIQILYLVQIEKKKLFPSTIATFFSLIIYIIIILVIRDTLLRLILFF